VIAERWFNLITCCWSWKYFVRRCPCTCSYNHDFPPQ